jgi:uncharacterized protein involved in response to NO
MTTAADQASRSAAASRAWHGAPVCVIVALIARVAMAALPAFAMPLMHLAAYAWLLAFAAFLAVYAPLTGLGSSPAK